MNFVCKVHYCPNKCRNGQSTSYICNNKKPLTMSGMGAHGVCDSFKCVYITGTKNVHDISHDSDVCLLFDNCFDGVIYVPRLRDVSMNCFCTVHD